MTAEPPCYLHINRNLIAHDVIDGEVVLVNTVSGFYFSLRGTGAAMWAGIEGGRSIAQVTQWTQEQYGLAPAEAAAAVAGLVEALVADDLLLRSDQPPAITADRSALLPAAGTPFTPPVVERFTEMQDLLTLDPIHEVDDLGWPHPAAKTT
ncbi:coenzyme PQQ synthesis protein D (PqqD) [Stella humosa]|uniref:Coenzyme PQQ synthesis protein D (PqqD) n=1 Tax=Stella humosa TaxID=94 RepID=A0A3N1M9P4_9PROT|nr:PqqD family protein [Stella humosa]ROP99948.1 coenzyme PQQ synthesis protein D (PqqD) [Stella humosa]BBK30822.1 hypothetical protein STHU_14560 [Stella humosa]